MAGCSLWRAQRRLNEAFCISFAHSCRFSLISITQPSKYRILSVLAVGLYREARRPGLPSSSLPSHGSARNRATAKRDSRAGSRTRVSRDQALLTPGPARGEGTEVLSDRRTS